MNFPKNFLWGAATSAFQIEGATETDGRGASTWDMMCRKKDTIADGHTGDIAADHYNHAVEDVALMKEIGLQAYRFSIAWSRVIPEGTGSVNKKGLDFYDRLVDNLLKNGIQPWVTLFHWDYPLKLFYRGGWLNRDSADWFADYTKIIVDKLSDRVKHWMTLNEIQCFIGGHAHGRNAPGIQLPFKEVLLAGHHALLAHGKSVQVIRANAKQSPLVSWAATGTISIPASNTHDDIEAARTHMFATKEKSAWQVGWWYDPVFLGKYPDDGLAFYGKDVPEYTDEDMKTINQPLDFFGTNIYTGDYIQHDKQNKYKMIDKTVGSDKSGIGVVPESLYWGSRFYFERYKLPIYITENGVSSLDWVSKDGMIHDAPRIDYLSKYLGALSGACEEKIPVLGYFYWALMDTFEWTHGYTLRMGLTHINYQTQKRTLKDSALWYKKVIESNGSSIE